MNRLQLSKYLIPLAYANIYIFWGSTYVAIAYGLESFPPFILSGLVIGFSGLLLFLQGSLSVAASAAETKGRVIAFVVLASSSIAWVLGSLYSRNHKPTQSTIMNITQQLIVGGLGSFLIATLRLEWGAFDVAAITFNAFAGLLFLVFFGSIVAYLSYIWLLSVQPAALVSTHIYVNPIVAVVLGWLLLGTQISNVQFAGLGIILSGVLLTNIGDKLRLRLPKLLRLRVEPKVSAA